jgi:Signal peptidase, peptidase S26
MPSESMEPAYSAGEVITVDLDAYDSAKPAIGDAVVFHPPQAWRPKDAVSRSSRIRQRRPVVNGSLALADVIQPCRHLQHETHHHDSAGSLLRHGRQQWRFFRQPLLGTDTRPRDHQEGD